MDPNATTDSTDSGTGSTLADISQLIQTAGMTGLTVWSNLSGKPIQTTQVNGSPVPIASATSTLTSTLLIVAVIAVAIYALAE